MEVFDDEFQFALEMVILARNENGATLSEIRDDFENYFGISFESIWGYKCWEQHIRPALPNVMLNINSKTLEGGCVLYYMNIDAAIRKLSDNVSENMLLICSQLDIDVNKLKEMWNASLTSQSRSTSHSRSTNTSIRNVNPKSTSSTISSTSEECEFYGHLLIGDNFFLEMAHIDLEYKNFSHNRIKQIGKCVSGQSISRAIKNISRTINEIHHDRVIINLGSVDLLQGKELIDMMKDMHELCDMLCRKGIFPILTTIAPLANQMHNKILEHKRKSFNTYIMAYFDYIDIERCFLSNYNRILFDLYQPEPKTVSGTSRPQVHWNHVGRQRVVKMLQRKIPEIYKEYY